MMPPLGLSLSKWDCGQEDACETGWQPAHEGSFRQRTVEQYAAQGQNFSGVCKKLTARMLILNSQGFSCKENVKNKVSFIEKKKKRMSDLYHIVESLF